MAELTMEALVEAFDETGEGMSRWISRGLTLVLCIFEEVEYVEYHGALSVPRLRRQLHGCLEAIWRRG